MLKLGKLYYTNRGFDLLSSSRKNEKIFKWNKITRQLTFLIISSTPSLKKKILHKFQITHLHLNNLFSFFLFVYLNIICDWFWLAAKLLARFRDHP